MSNITEKEATKTNFFKKISEAFKNIFSSRIFIAIIFLITGSMITNSCNKTTHKHYYHYSHDDIFDYEDDDFFAEFEDFNKKFYKAMENHQRIIKKAFNDKKNSLENSKISASITQNQDENFYYYELNYRGINPEDLNVIIDKGFLTFSSNKTDIKKIDKDDKTYNSQASSNFYYSINIPLFDEKISPEILKNNEKITVKLKKISENKIKK